MYNYFILYWEVNYVEPKFKCTNDTIIDLVSIERYRTKLEICTYPLGINLIFKNLELSSFIKSLNLGM